MGNFDRGGGYNDRRGGGGFGRRDSGRSFDRGGDRSMHKAVCDECKNDCEVPFRPSSGKPIFCSDCFSKQGGGGDRSNKFGGDRPQRPRFEDRGGSKPNPESKEILKAIKTLNYKLDQLTKVLAPSLVEESKESKEDTKPTKETKVEKPAAKKAVKKAAKKAVKKKAAKKPAAKKPAAKKK